MRVDREELKKYILLAIFIFCILIYGIYQLSKKTEKYKNRGARFTVGEITFADTRSSAHGLLFKFKGEIIEVSTSPFGDWPNGWREKNIEGRKVYVVFPSKSPENANFFAGFRVPVNLPSPPYRGWKLEELQKLDPNFSPEDFSDWW